MDKLYLLLLIIIIFCTVYSKCQNIPRAEYPRPQFERADWINLNGEWTFSFDFGKSGEERGFAFSNGFDKKIIVPFCPESKLSGVEHKDFIERLWYHRKISIPEKWAGKKIILHFGAVDYESEVFIDGKTLGVHFGGTSSFYYDITNNITPGKEHNLVVYVKDEFRTNKQPSGKQCFSFKSQGCNYTRTTGIWQTVWLEPVDHKGLASCQILPDPDNKRFIFSPKFFSLEKGMKFKVTVSDENKKIAENEILAGDNIPSIIEIKNPKTWSPENPFLYNITYKVIDKNEKIIDEVKSYAGLRKIHVEGNKIFLNNKPQYIRFVLDQGFYPDGIWTAPSDAALKNDIILSMKAGFNGARLHQKVFEERFHYWADKLGYLTWGESSSWGVDCNDPVSARNFISEWEEIVMRDKNHPSIIGWSPFNETWGRSKDGRQHNRLLIDVYDLTHNLDPTRPVNETSGNYHIKTDLYTVHLYEQDPIKFKEALTPDKEKGVFRMFPKIDVEYSGQPYLVDEYGGIKWIAAKAFADNSWGYGDGPKTVEEFYSRLEKLTDVILDLDHICGYCYTQLTDVEQEQNGIYNYDRTEKFDMKRISSIFKKEKIKK